MTYEQTREQFLLAWNSNAYLNMCESEDMKNAIEALGTMAEMEKRNISTKTILEYAKFEDECIQKGFTFKSLLEAREKQTAKKPQMRHIKSFDGYNDGWCPCCGSYVQESEYDKIYCQECGQKLDWKVE